MSGPGPTCSSQDAVTRRTCVACLLLCNRADTLITRGIDPRYLLKHSKIDVHYAEHWCNERSLPRKNLCGGQIHVLHTNFSGRL